MMSDEMSGNLRKELEAILREQDGELPPCRYHRHVPPPGCILGWDISQCNFCSFYQPTDMPERRKDENRE